MHVQRQSCDCQSCCVSLLAILVRVLFNKAHAKLLLSVSLRVKISQLLFREHRHGDRAVRVFSDTSEKPRQIEKTINPQ